MRTYKVKIPATISITWSQELVEDKENFYVRLKPHINLGGVRGADRVRRIQTGSGSRYVLTKAYNDLFKQIQMDNEFKEEVKKIMKGGRPAQTQVKVKTPVSAAPRLQTQLSAEDFAAGTFGREQTQEHERPLATGFSAKEIEKLEKGE